MNKLYKPIFRYFESLYPEEACGIVINRMGILEWFPCVNISTDKLNSFVISGVDYIKANMLGDIEYVVHSHPDKESALSEEDVKASEFLKVKYMVVSVPSLIVTEYTPKTRINPLVGRKYEEKETDCWSLIQDYYLLKYNKVLTICDHYSEDWRDNGVPYYNDTDIRKLGFEEVEEPEIGDIVMFNVMSINPNHFGIYLGGNIFLHHADNRLSCREPLQGLWIKYLKGFLRCKKFI